MKKKVFRENCEYVPTYWYTYTKQTKKQDSFFSLGEYLEPHTCEPGHNKKRIWLGY